MNLFRTAFAMFGFVLFITSVYSQTFQNVPVFYRNSGDNVNADEGEEIFRARNSWLNHLRNGTFDDVKITIPSSDGGKTLEMSKREIVAESGALVTTASGQSFYTDPGVYYSGKFQNEENSSGVLGVRGSQLTLVTQDAIFLNLRISNVLMKMILMERVSKRKLTVIN